MVNVVMFVWFTLGTYLAVRHTREYANDPLGVVIAYVCPPLYLAVRFVVRRIPWIGE